MNKSIFEASFTNLDLSEFDTPSSSSSSSSNSVPIPGATGGAAIPYQSASQQLLDTKQQEYAKNNYENEQEEYIQMKAKQRKDEYHKQQQKEQVEQMNQKNNIDNNNANGAFFNALLSMHDNDAFGKKLETSGIKTKAQKRTIMKSTGVGGSKGGQRGKYNGGSAKFSNKTTKIKKGAVKKSRQSKHYKR